MCRWGLWSFLVWEEQVDGSAAEHDHGGGGFGGVEPVGAADDQADLVVHAFDAAVGKSEADCGLDAVVVGADGAAQLDEAGDAAALRPGQPACQQDGDLVFVQVTGEDRA